MVTLCVQAKYGDGIGKSQNYQLFILDVIESEGAEPERYYFQRYHQGDCMKCGFD